MDLESLASLRHLLDTRPVAALATLHRGEPAASMVPFVLLPAEACMAIHVSALATHTRDMIEHPRVALLVMAETASAASAAHLPAAGAPGRGSGARSAAGTTAAGTSTSASALPRVSLQCDAALLPRDALAHDAVRDAYLARLPDAAVTFELADFSLFLLRPVSARLVGGFGRAGSLVGERLLQWLRGGP